jgi:hypothetical protein
MFQTVEPKQIFDSSYWQVSEDEPAYWLAQLRKPEWRALLDFVHVKMGSSLRKPDLAGLALEHYAFRLCPKREEVRSVWLALHQQGCPALVMQFRHSETDWTRGLPEFVHLEKDEPLGFVNIAAWLVCRVRHPRESIIFPTLEAER